MISPSFSKIMTSLSSVYPERFNPQSRQTSITNSITQTLNIITLHLNSTIRILSSIIFLLIIIRSSIIMKRLIFLIKNKLYKNRCNQNPVLIIPPMIFYQKNKKLSKFLKLRNSQAPIWQTLYLQVSNLADHFRIILIKKWDFKKLRNLTMISTMIERITLLRQKITAFKIPKMTNLQNNHHKNLVKQIPWVLKNPK